MSDPEIDAVLADMRATMAQFRQETDAVADELAKDRAKDAESRDAVETARRNGEHGPEWRAVQQSIDLGKTTLDDVIRGVDHSPEAQALRAMMQKVLPGARAKFAELVDTQIEAGDLAALQQAQQDLAKSLADLNRLNANL
jgi:hypothetical protein